MKRSICLLVAVATLMLLVGACGKDGGQGRPAVDTVPPNPPTGIDIECQGNAVLITWDENPEVDLAGYRLYKSSLEDGPFGQLNSRLIMCPWCEDQVISMAMTYYKLTAVDESGNESAFSQLAGIYTNTGGRDQPDTPASQ
jgi:hypothetical protein